MRALERANLVRLARAELKRAIARGDIDASEVVRECPWETESMTIAELLTSQRRWGRTRARKFLLPLSLNENKQLGTLTSRQRRLLSTELASRTAGGRERADAPRPGSAAHSADPEAEASGGALECAARQVEGDREGDRADRRGDRQDLVGEVEEAADREARRRRPPAGWCGSGSRRSARGSRPRCRRARPGRRRRRSRSGAGRRCRSISETMPPRIVSSASGNVPQGAGGRSSGVATRARASGRPRFGRRRLPRSLCLALLAQRPQAARLTGIPRRP